MLNYSRSIRVTVIIAALLAATGCGFKQRGSLTVPDYLRVVYITPDDPYEYLQRELRYRLAKHNIKVIDHPSEEAAILELSAPTIGKQILARGPSGQVQRFSLSMSTQYKMIIKSKQYESATKTISRSREVSITNDKLLSNENSEQIIKKELLTETVNELLRQFTRPLNKAAALDSSTADNNPC